MDSFLTAIGVKEDPRATQHLQRAQQHLNAASGSLDNVSHSRKESSEAQLSQKIDRQARQQLNRPPTIRTATPSKRTRAVPLTQQPLDELVERGERLEELARKSDDLSFQTKAFSERAKDLNRCCPACPSRSVLLVVGALLAGVSATLGFAGKIGPWKAGLTTAGSLALMGSTAIFIGRGNDG